MASYNILTLSEPVTDFVATTSPATINLQCGLMEDAQRKKVYAVYKAGGMPEHPYDGVRVEMEVMLGFPLSDLDVENEILLPFDASSRLFIIVHKQADRVIVGQKYLYEKYTINSGAYLFWRDSFARTELNGDAYFGKFPQKIQDQILLSSVDTYSNTSKKIITTQDHVYLASCTEMQVAEWHTEGEAFGYFTSNASRKAMEAEDMATAANYMMRSKATDNEDTSKYNAGINASGARATYAVSGDTYLYCREFFALSPNMLLDFTPNPDGSFNPIL